MNESLVIYLFSAIYRGCNVICDRVLNAHCFLMVGDGHQPNCVGVSSIPSLERFPIKGSMTITLAPI